MPDDSNPLTEGPLLRGQGESSSKWSPKKDLNGTISSQKPIQNQLGGDIHDKIVSKRENLGREVSHALICSSFILFIFSLSRRCLLAIRT